MPSLDQLLTLEYGQALPAHARTNSGYPVYGSNGVVGYHETPLVQGPGAIVGRKGSVGRVHWTERSFWPIDTTYYVASRGDHIRWLYRVLDWATLEALDTSTGVPGLNRNDVYRIDVFRPPQPEQCEIARILDTLDAQIHWTKELIAKLEQIKQGLLTDLLTRGIDENGQLRPSPEQAPHLYKDSPLGRIPKEWGLSEVANLGDLVTGSTPPSTDPNAWGNALPFVTPVDIGPHDEVDRAERALSKRGLAYVRKLLPGSTLVVCIGSTISKVGFAAVPMATNQQINALLPNEDNDSRFVFLAVRENVGQILAWAGLQAVPIVNKSTFGRMRIPLPPRSEQGAISDRAMAINARITTENTALEKLREERSGLMDDLLTGRVRVLPLTERAAG